MTYLPSDESNPFRAPQARIGEYANSVDSPLGGQAELIRREHINHEASIKALGFLYYLGTFFTGIASIFMLVMGAGLMAMPQANRPNQPDVPPAMMQGIFLGLGVLYFALMILQGFLGHGLRGLRVWARWTVIVLTGLLLLYILGAGLVLMFVVSPIGGVLYLGLGSLIPGYIMYLMASSKGAMVFSADYKEIIRQTPYVKPRTSLAAKIVLIVIIAIILLVVVSAFMRSNG